MGCRFHHYQGLPLLAPLEAQLPAPSTLKLESLARDAHNNQKHEAKSVIGYLSNVLSLISSSLSLLMMKSDFCLFLCSEI